jgi:dolichol kinase
MRAVNPSASVWTKRNPKSAADVRNAGASLLGCGWRQHNVHLAPVLFISAMLWLAAGRVKAPMIHGVLSDVGEPLRELTRALEKQSKLNWLGAIFAALGLLAQAAAIFLRSGYPA